MRVLVVDQDSTLLTAITQLLGEYFSIDAVTTKSDCLDLVRANDFDVIVAGERLADGSGLELLGQMQKNRPDMLRIFAVERERRKLLKGRLGPFGLFRTLSYPIDPRQLLAALSAAAGIEEEPQESQHEPEPVAAAPSRPIAAPSRPVAAPAPMNVTVRSVRKPAVATPVSRPVARAPQPRQAAHAAAAAPVRHDFEIVDEEPTPPPPPPRARKANKSRTPGPAGKGSATPAQLAPTGRSVRQPTVDSLAVGARLAAETRSKAPPLMDANTKRNAVFVGVSVVAVIGVIAVALHMLNSSDTHKFSTANIAAKQPGRDPPEVVKLLSDTETAFQHDDYKSARTDIAALQQIAPTHARLPFFESLLEKREAEAKKLQARRTPPQAPPPQRVASAAPTHSSGISVAHSPRIPSSAPIGAPLFSGQTVEDSNLPGGDTRDAELIERVAAEYPDAAAQKGIEGAVDLSFVVSPKGEVQNVTVIHATPSNIFNRAAITAVRHWKYKPKMVNGVPTDAQIQLRVSFKLDH